MMTNTYASFGNGTPTFSNAKGQVSTDISTSPTWPHATSTANEGTSLNGPVIDGSTQRTLISPQGSWEENATSPIVIPPRIRSINPALVFPCDRISFERYMPPPLYMYEDSPPMSPPFSDYFPFVPDQMSPCGSDPEWLESLEDAYPKSPPKRRYLDTPAPPPSPAAHTPHLHHHQSHQHQSHQNQNQQEFAGSVSPTFDKLPSQDGAEKKRKPNKPKPKMKTPTSKSKKAQRTNMSWVLRYTGLTDLMKESKNGAEPLLKPGARILLGPDARSEVELMADGTLKIVQNNKLGAQTFPTLWSWALLFYGHNCSAWQLARLKDNPSVTLGMLKREYVNREYGSNPAGFVAEKDGGCDTSSEGDN